MSNCRKHSGQGRSSSGVKEQPTCFFDHLLKVVDTHSDQRQVAQLIALFSSDQRKLFDFKNPPAPAPSEGRCWPNTASKKKGIQLEKQGQYEALKKQFTGDAYLVDMGRPMSTATAEKRMQNFVDSKRTLQQLYNDQEPGFRRYLLEDDVIPDLIEAYDRRILEMSWRIAGPEGRDAALEDHLDPNRLEEEAPESEYSMLGTNMPDLGDRVEEEAPESDYSMLETNMPDLDQEYVQTLEANPEDDYAEETACGKEAIDQEYVRALEAYHDDAYGEETACGKEAMGKRKMDLMRRINTLMVFEKQHMTKYPDHDMPDDDYSPAGLIRAMQAKVDIYEKKLLNIRHPGGYRACYPNTLKPKKPYVIPDRARPSVNAEESDASSGEEAEDQYVDTQPRAQAAYIPDDDPEYDGRRKHRTLPLHESWIFPDKRVTMLSRKRKESLLNRPNPSCRSKGQLLLSPDEDPGYRDAVAKFRKDAYSYEPATNKADITKRKEEIEALMDRLNTIEEEHVLLYPRDVIQDSKNSPKALIAAFQDKIDSLEWKLLQLAQSR